MRELKMIDGIDFNAELRNLPYAILDLETTGIDHRSDGITEFAAILYDRGKTETFEQLINPEMPIPQAVADITGITDAMVAREPNFAEVAPVIHNLLEKRVFVSHNVPFDRGFLQFNLRRSISKTLETPSICTLKLSRAMLGLRSNKLENVLRHFGKKLEGAHRAMNDTEGVKDLLLEFFTILEGKGLRTLSDLARERLLIY